MSSNPVNPLQWNVPIVDSRGAPTAEFMQKWNRQQADVNTTIPAAADPTATASDVVKKGTASTYMRSDAAPAVQKGSDTLFGIFKVDNSTVFATAGVLSAVSPTPPIPGIDKIIDRNVISMYRDGVAVGTGGGGGVTFANPTATASDAAVNGVATTAMRSDAAPAVQKATTGQFGVVKPDGTTITVAGGVISTSVKSAITSFNVSTVYATGAFATRGVIINCVQSFTLTDLWACIGGTAAAQYEAQVYAVDATQKVTAVLGVSATFSFPDGNAACPVFHFSTPLSLVAGTTYALVIVRVDGTGTTTNQIADPNSATIFLPCFDINTGTNLQIRDTALSYVVGNTIATNTGFNPAINIIGYR